MKGCVLGRLKVPECDKWLLKEGKKIFDEIMYIPIPHVNIRFENRKMRVFYEDIDLSEFDFIIPRIPRSYAWLGFNVLNILKDDVYIPIEPESVIIVHNKFMTLLALKEAGLPVPETYLTISRDSLDTLLDEARYPVVLKLLYGSLGIGVMFAESKSSAISMMDTLERFKEPIFLEEYVPNPGEDIRPFVLGNDVIAAMKRKAQKGERRTNIGIGGEGEAIELDWRLKDLAVKTAKVLGMDICGVDIIVGPKGPVIIEANVSVLFEGITKTTGVNVAKAIVEYVKKETDLFKRPRLGRLFRLIRR